MQDKFGPTFKLLREKRGFSVKETAGKIITPAALRKFENGETSTSVDNFNKLLFSIGADWEDFFNLYEGNTVMSLLCQQVEAMNDLQVKREYHRLNEVILDMKKEIEENPNLSGILGLATELSINSRKDNIIPIDKNSPRFKPIFRHFDKVETWGVFEISIFYQTLRLFEPESVDFYIHKILDNFETKPPRDKHDWPATITIALYTITYFSKQGAFAYADRMINRLEKMLAKDKYVGLWDEKLSLTMFKATHLVRQNKPEGLELAKKVIQAYQLFGESFHSPYAIRDMNDYMDFIHSINKTGIPFKPFDD